MRSIRHIGIAAMLALAACPADEDPTGTGDNNNKGGNNNNNQPPSQPGGTPVATATVDIRDDYFSPNSVLLSAGGTVTWTWIGGNGHSVTPDDTPFSPTAPVSYPPKSLAVTFPATGDYRYFCQTHGVPGYYSSGSMVGVVYVR